MPAMPDVVLDIPMNYKNLNYEIETGCLFYVERQALNYEL